MLATRRGLALRNESYEESARKRDKALTRRGLRDKMKLKQPDPVETQQKTLAGEDVSE